MRLVQVGLMRLGHSKHAIRLQVAPSISELVELILDKNASGERGQILGRRASLRSSSPGCHAHKNGRFDAAVG